MSKMVNAVKEQRKEQTNHQVLNFMGGINYELDPMETLKMVTASSIFGEPQYYRDGEFAEKGALADAKFNVGKLFAEYSILSLDKYSGMKTSQLMEKVIDEALDYDYTGVLEWAKRLRKEFYMRLNPQVIMVRAAMHEKRAAFTEANPGVFHAVNMEVMSRADDVINQISYFLYINGSKNKVPGILKKSWSKKLSSLSRYEVSKYKNSGIGMVDAVRISHASSDVITSLMKTGTVEVPEDELTWEKMRSNGKEWKDILETIRMPHMALLRNVRNILTDVTDDETVDAVLANLKAGVKNGKQFPFRYMTSRNAVLKAGDKLNGNAMKAADALEDCMDIACENLPKLSGYSAFLSDNSGSAWGQATSEYGSVTVAKIDNLSAVIGAVNSDKGIVVPFGNEMKKIEVSKRKGILAQADEVTVEGNKLGKATEGGIWKFFADALGYDNNGHVTGKTIKYDNICVFSDMQAGTGDLYGTGKDNDVYKKLGFECNGHYINVAKLIEEYRKKVNPKVNVYLVQTAGYNNACVPSSGYRTTLLYGWTGKELQYMDIMNKFWDECDKKRNL